MGGEPREILKLYTYYANLYLNHPALFYWAGLGKMAGGAVVGGVDFLVRMMGEAPRGAKGVATGRDFVTRKMVEIGKAIFEDLAWQHEAFLDDFDNLLRLAAERDAAQPTPASSYLKAWQDIGSGVQERIFAGSQGLLRNEQFVIIQPRYNEILANQEQNGVDDFSHTSQFTFNIHPYHRRFHKGDVLVKDDRWAWITEPDGMWEKWKIMPQFERERLVKQRLEDLTDRKWGQPLVDSLLPVGAHDDEDG